MVINFECLMFNFPTRISRIFDSFGVFPLRLNENTRCLQRKRIREIREIRVGNQEGSGQDEQASVQGDELTMLNVE